jgi:hypothetical protein
MLLLWIIGEILRISRISWEQVADAKINTKGVGGFRNIYARVAQFMGLAYKTF